jgi:hypothetical protein
MDVFFVETPLQMLNAIEAKHALGLSDTRVVILLSDIYSKASFRPFLSDEQWGGTEYVESRILPSRAVGWLCGRVPQRIRSYYETIGLRGLRERLDRQAEAVGAADALLIGNYYLPHMRHFANVLPHRELILIDDGTATLEIAEERQRHAHGHARVPKFRAEQLVNRVVGWRLEHQPRATFFTIYETAVGPLDRKIQHAYSYLRAKAADFECSGEVLFLGQTIYYEGITEDAYMQQLRRVRQHFAGEKLVYAPHKGEMPERVNRIREEFGWEIRRYDVPIEYQLAMRGPLPKVLASFYSSALENCRLIFGPRLRIESVYLEPRLFVRAADFVQSVYEYYQSKTTEQFRVVRA